MAIIENITPVRFTNRRDAGQMLALDLDLDELKKDSPLILALPRGGVPVAYELAAALPTKLDTLVVRKIGAPSNPEYAVGAIAPGDVLVLDKNATLALGISQDELDRIIRSEMDEMERRILHYKSGTYSKDNPADTVIIVDDGLATGLTALAAIESAKITMKPRRIIFAAPVCAKDTAEKLRGEVELICLNEIENLGAVGNWYQNFEQVSDAEVINYLESANASIKM
jgi:putative phosphoribosyl transferase